MKNILIIICCIFSLSIFGQDNKMKQVGEEVLEVHESPHPYSGTENFSGEIVWSEEIVCSKASYIAVHFNKVELSEGDFIIVRSTNNDRSWKYKNLNVESGGQGVWSIHIYGEKLIIEIHSKNKEGSYGYSIDKIARGYTATEMQNNSLESICRLDNSREAKCYKNTEPQVYNKAKAVARLMINGTGACTGWLIGNDGHLMTNNHCIKNATDANNVTVEFLAEGANCNTNCQSSYACSGTIEATSATLVKTDFSLDYSLLKLPNNVSNKYGYLQLRKTGPVLNERIYIPQHPQAWGKRVSLLSDDDPGGLSVVNSLSQLRCRGGDGSDVGYFADTRGGSSGSPVISHNDHLVVALHHCGGCPNKGVSTQDIINHLGANLPPNATGISSNGLTVINPGTGDTYAPGDVININWNINEDVFILMYASTGGYSTVTDFGGLNGSYSYQIPFDTRPGQYRIFIHSISSSNKAFGGYFTIQSTNLSCGSDANTLLLLPFDNNLHGFDGERPLTSTAVGFTANGKYNNAIGIFESSITTSLKYAAGNNINSQKGTVEAWVKPTWNGDDGKGHTLLQYGDNGGLLIIKDGANNLRLILNLFSPSGYPEMDVSTNIGTWRANQWKHIAFTWGNGSLKLYIDGTQVSEQPYTDLLYPVNDAHFSIGTYNGGLNWQGAIDHLRISNTVRSDSEIIDFMNNCREAKLAHNRTIEMNNFPNPFDSQTTISYTLQEDSPVTFTVYDGMGKQVALLHDQETKKVGTHSINFDGSNYPAGIYYYSIQAGDFVDTQKMILMR